MMWQTLTFLGRATAFPLAFAAIVLGVEVKSAMVAPAPDQVVAAPQIDLSASRETWLKERGVPSNVVVALRASRIE
jgi:hypothetical protein